MKKAILFFVLTLLFFSCRKKPDTKSESTIGQLNVDLNALSEHIRTQEALIGNFICDAIKKQMEKKEISFDAVLLIAGSIRYDLNKRPDGIYYKGNITSDMIDEMLPFVENKVVKVKVNGYELKQIMERSVALLPLNKGSFLQLSENISIDVDVNQQAQIIDETVIPNKIVVEGNRITDTIWRSLRQSAYRYARSNRSCIQTDEPRCFILQLNQY
ncbi:MAG: 5'-nucleotidase C-terminal domain-containing protein [Flavobacteriia bacterium]|nr:5'-nucleotidase C-terminal domain-containing protein [Flavobacteriia bacterium]